MKLTEKQLFESLRKDREESAKVLEKDSMRGVERSATEKYSDLAHFVYEILQNADDVKATKVEFIVKPKQLIFIHNGRERFTVSDVITEGEDRKQQGLGHINSITSIGNSNKTEAQIGKFGVGFKAVFQYTDTPHIYDTPFCFKIERFIVPVLLENGCEYKKDDNTVFIFPFDKGDKPPEKCYEEILQKLKDLRNPILFLKHLTDIEWRAENNEGGSYQKTILHSFEQGGITVEKLEIIKRIDGQPESECLYLFTKQIPESEYSCRIAYRVNESDGVLHDREIPAYCFFETKEVTHLKFFVHAPFLLTDSREGIPQDKESNQKCIKELAKLTAGSLPICQDMGLINDNFFNVLPLNSQNFLDDGDSKNQFSPIYQEVLAKLRTDSLLPVNDGESFTTKNNAYLADGKKLKKLLDLPAKDERKSLAVLAGNQGAKWVFTTVTDKQESFWTYIKDNLVQEVIDSEKFARKISKDFIEKQTDEWLIEFYSFISDIPSLWQKDRKDNILRYKEILRLEDDRIVAPFDKNNLDKPQAYLPDKTGNKFKKVDSSFPLIKHCFVKSIDSENFLKQLGITKPKDRAKIDLLIEKYREKNLFGGEPILLADVINCELSEEELKSDFEEILIYAHSLEKELNNLLEDIKDVKFCVAIKNTSTQEQYLVPSQSVYYPDDNLKSYFEGQEDVFWLDVDFYPKKLKKKNVNLLRLQLSRLVDKIQIEFRPRYRPLKLSLEQSTLDNLEVKIIPKPTQINSIVDYDLHGLENCLDRIKSDSDLDKSVLIWDCLNNYKLDGSPYKGKVDYKYRTIKKYEFDSKIIKMLKDSAWLYTKKRQFKKPSEIAIEELSNKYDSGNMQDDFLKSIGLLSQEERDQKLSDEDKLLYKIFEMYPGKTTQEILLLLEEKRNKKNSTPKGSDSASSKTEETSTERLTKRLVEGAKKKRSTGERRQSSQSQETKSETPQLPPSDTNGVEEDEYNPPRVDREEKVKKLQEKLETEIADLDRKEELNNILANSDKYSFAWFKALLELEDDAARENRAKKNPIRVKFSRVEWDEDSKEILVLSQTDFIPYSVEENPELELTLNFKKNSKFPNDGKSVPIEAVSLRQKLLKAKLKNPALIEDLDLSEVENAVIEVKNADFILENLRNSFDKLPFDDDYNFQQNLTPNIKFIFGPPGTGKTTHLATKEILPRMEDDLKILVLAPTNKAADVLTEKIIEECEKSGNSYSWLIRYGETKSDKVENTVFVKSKYLPRSILKKVVMVTTIARFPYDNFKVENPTGEDWDFPIKNFHWDYIIFDEASMISLASIVYALYYAAPNRERDCEFIVGGDPFQIGPVIRVSEDGWKDGNIYTLVGLDKDDSFVNPQTTPHDFDVLNLTTQYRSIPQLGELFSEFRYNSILKHHRSEEEIKPINVNRLPLKPLTLVNFKVSQFESIYKSRKIKGSPYQIYSAILAVELVNYIVREITLPPENRDYKIGVICPYRIQQNIIDKLLAKTPLPDGIELMTGTIHGFQGDECDLILTVFNPPTNISSNPEIFLNKKNLLNVAISRAKDYLILLLPHDETNYIKTKELLYIEEMKNRIGNNCQKYQGDRIEEIILGKREAIEEFSFTTSHQSVNVYSNPDRKYEIRYDENAVDIQLRLETP